MDIISLPVLGMDCYECSKVIKKTVKKVDGIYNVEVNYMLGTVKVSFDSTKTSKTKIEEAIEKAGYRLAYKNYETVSDKFKKIIYKKEEK